MNSELYDKKVELPDLLIKHLSDSIKKVNGVNKDSEGYKRNVELQQNKIIGYPQLKRIKNFFDTFNGDINDTNFILNGGLPMKSWVDTTLNSLRSSIESIKKRKKESGQQNTYIKPHEKSNINIRPSKKHVRTIHKYDTSIGNLPKPVLEEIERIKDILKKIM